MSNILHSHLYILFCCFVKFNFFVHLCVIIYYILSLFIFIFLWYLSITFSIVCCFARTDHSEQDPGIWTRLPHSWGTENGLNTNRQSRMKIERTTSDYNVAHMLTSLSLFPSLPFFLDCTPQYVVHRSQIVLQSCSPLWQRGSKRQSFQCIRKW